MDEVLRLFDDHVSTPYLYPSSWPAESPIRQFVSLLIIVYLGAVTLYLGTASFCYFFLFDKRLMQHPRFLPNQIRTEIQYSMVSLPLMNIPTTAMFFLHIQGYGKTYDGVSADTWLGYLSLPMEFVLVVLFTDMMIYWTHRAFHHRILYSAIHKPHHAFKVPTPFASHAFHPVDGFMQGFPYHLFPLILPLNKYLYLGFFVLVNFWTVSIHDGNCKVPNLLKPVVNGSAHHTDHHLYYNYNYGQFFTFWDRVAGSYRTPSAFEGDAPVREVIERDRRSKIEGRRTEPEFKETVSTPEMSDGEFRTLKRRGATRRMVAS